MNFPDLFTQLGIPFRASGHEHCRPGWLQVDCPRCAQHQHWRLGVHLATGASHCWACGRVPLAEAIREATWASWGQVKELLAQVPRQARARLERPPGKLVLPPGLGPLLGCHRDYLASRGFDPDQLAARYGLQGIGIAGGKYQWRVFIPIVHRGELVSWTTRCLHDQGLRYVSAAADQERLPHRDLLYGEDLCQHAVCVCEGPFDAIALGPGAVATFGLAYSRQQVLRLARYPLRIVCFDKERAAQQTARRLCDALSGFPGKTRNVVIETGKDPATATEEERQQIRKLMEE